MLRHAKKRAEENGVPFNLTLDDIVIPEVCPIFGLTLTFGGGEARPTLDRVRPELGYVPGNVLVISGRANRIKSDATLTELEKLTEYMRLC